MTLLAPRRCAALSWVILAAGTGWSITPPAPQPAPVSASRPPTALVIGEVFLGTRYGPDHTVVGHDRQWFIEVPDEVPADEDLVWKRFLPYRDRYSSMIAEGPPLARPRVFTLVSDDDECRLTGTRQVYIRAGGKGTAAVEVDLEPCRGYASTYRFAYEN